jgi:hypothetical protein
MARRTKKAAAALDENQKLILTVLAEGDAAFLPMRGRRQWNSNLPTNGYFARKAFADAGVEWRSGGSSAGERMAGMRLLEAARDAGLVTLTRRRSVRWIHVKLSEAAESEARTLATLPSLADSISLMTRISELSVLGEPGWLRRNGGAPERPVPCHWIAEACLIAPTLPREAFVTACCHIEDSALPAITRGWLDGNGDYKENSDGGHAYYRLTDDGTQALQQGLPPAPGRSAPPPCPDAIELYYGARLAACQRLEKADKVKPAELGNRLPLYVGAAIWPEDLAESPAASDE